MRWGFSTSAVTGPQQGGRLALPPGVATKRLSKIPSTEPGWGKILLSTINGFAFWTESFSAGWFRFWSIYFEAALCSGHQENSQWNDDKHRPLWAEQKKKAPPYLKTRVEANRYIQYSHKVILSYRVFFYTGPPLRNLRRRYRVFFLNWYPPKKLKYGKPRLGESTLT